MVFEFLTVKPKKMDDRNDQRSTDLVNTRCWSYRKNLYIDHKKHFHRKAPRISVKNEALERNMRNMRKHGILRARFDSQM